MSNDGLKLVGRLRVADVCKTLSIHKTWNRTWNTSAPSIPGVIGSSGNTDSGLCALSNCCEPSDVITDLFDHVRWQSSLDCLKLLLYPFCRSQLPR